MLKVPNFCLSEIPNRSQLVARSSPEDFTSNAAAQTWHKAPSISLKRGAKSMPAAALDSMSAQNSSPLSNHSPAQPSLAKPHATRPQPLAELDWVQELTAQPGMEPVLTAGAMLSDSTELPDDHMFSALLAANLVRDMTCLYDAPRQQFHTLISLGRNICGHKGICHGGLTAMIIDETLGGLSYVLKRDGVIGKGPAFTAHLDVDYKKPVLAGSELICSATVESIEGRKTWVTATVLDRPGGALLAQGRALFVIPRSMVPASDAASEAAPAAAALSAQQQ